MNDFDFDRPWRLNERVALRPERFGALAYDFGTRRLSFLKSRKLLELVEGLDKHTTARIACDSAGIADADLPTYGRALAALAESGLIRQRKPA